MPHPYSLQSLARLAVVRLGCRPYHHLLLRSLLIYYSLWWDDVGPIYFNIEGVEGNGINGDNGIKYKQSKVRVGKNAVSPLDDAFIHAARRGNLGLTELCKELGASSTITNGNNVINAAMAAAAEGGHEVIVRWCHYTWGAADVDIAMAAAAKKKRGHEAIVRLCHDEWGAAEVDEAMVHAARYGHEVLVRLCHDVWGASSYYSLNGAMAKAAKGGHEAIMRLCHDEWGADDVNRAMAEAAKGGHEALVRLCHDESE
jgi:hypothetical protein